MIVDLFAWFGLLCAAAIGVGIWELHRNKVTFAQLKAAIAALKSKL